MKTKTDLLIEMLIEARSRFTKLLPSLTESDLVKKLPPAANSVGFLIRHIGDVELLFTKNVFGLGELKVHAQTVIDQRDTGVWTELDELLAHQKFAFEKLLEIVATQTDEDWEEIIETKEFGRKTKAEALSRILSHTSYHAGQMALILKYAV